MTDKTLVHYDVQNGVAVLTLDDPPANTYTHEMMVQLDQAIVRARFDEDAEVIVVTGAGEKFFCAGANIQMLSEVTSGFKYCFCLHANETLNRFEHTPKLVIGALNGHTVGGGLEIAMACDRTVYDSIFVALASRLGCRLVTADKRLVNALASREIGSSLLWLGDLDNLS